MDYSDNTYHIVMRSIENSDAGAYIEIVTGNEYARALSESLNTDIQQQVKISFEARKPLLIGGRGLIGNLINDLHNSTTRPFRVP